MKSEMKREETEGYRLQCLKKRESTTLTSAPELWVVWLLPHKMPTEPQIASNEQSAWQEP